MRWVFFLILAYLATVVQTSLGHMLVLWDGLVSPDLLATVAVFFALTLRSSTDAALAAWVLGTLAELTAGGGPAVAVTIGPMGVCYALAGWLVFQLRELFFRERIVTRVLLGLVFALLAHVLWVTTQSLLAVSEMTWSAYGRTVGQAIALAVYTALITPVVCGGLSRLQRVFVSPPAGRSRR